MNRIILFVLLLGCVTFQKANAAEVRKVEEKSFDMPAGGSVTLIGDEGSVNVKSWGKNQVHLRMVKTVWERDEGQCFKCGATEEVAVYCIEPYGMPTEKNTKILCKPCKRLL